jgi:hypothetical protein
MSRSHARGFMWLALAVVASPLSAAALPDLKVTAVSGTPASLAAGGSFSLSNTVRSSGGAAGSFTVGLYLSTDSTISTSDILIGSRTVSSLASGASSAATTTVTVPVSVAPRAYYVGALADSAGKIAESNENNNYRVDATRVAVSAAPDLTVTAVAGAPARIGVGDGFTVTDTVAAAGSAAGAFTVGYYLAPSGAALNTGTLLGSRSVASLAAGATSGGNAALVIPSMPQGTYVFGAVVDSGNAVVESSEANNALAGGTVVVGAYSCQHPATPLDDGNPCTVDACDPVTGVIHAPDGTATACDDGNLCTYSDHCDGAGHCTGVAVSCVSAGPCQLVHCDGSAACSLSLRPAGSTCSSSVSTCGQVCDGVSPNCQPAE